LTLGVFQALTTDKKQYKAQKDEADRFAELEQEYHEIETQHVLYNLFHVEEDVAKAQDQQEACQVSYDKLKKRRKTIQDKVKAKKQTVRGLTVHSRCHPKC